MFEKIENNPPQSEPTLVEKIESWDTGLLQHTHKQLEAQRKKLIEELKTIEEGERAKTADVIKELEGKGRTIGMELKKRGIDIQWT